MICYGAGVRRDAVSVQASMTSSKGAGGFGRHEAEHLVQDRVHDGGAGGSRRSVVVVLGLPDADIAQAALGEPGQVGDQAGRLFWA